MGTDGHGYHLSMYDPRITMCLIHRYGEARAAGADELAGRLLGEIVLALDVPAYGQQEAPQPSGEDCGALKLLAG